MREDALATSVSAQRAVSRRRRNALAISEAELGLVAGASVIDDSNHR